MTWVLYFIFLFKNISLIQSFCFTSEIFFDLASSVMDTTYLVTYHVFSGRKKLG